MMVAFAACFLQLAAKEAPAAAQPGRGHNMMTGLRRWFPGRGKDSRLPCSQQRDRRGLLPRRLLPAAGGGRRREIRGRISRQLPATVSGISRRLPCGQGRGCRASASIAAWFLQLVADYMTLAAQAATDVDRSAAACCSPCLSAHHEIAKMAAAASSNWAAIRLNHLLRCAAV